MKKSKEDLIISRQKEAHELMMKFVEGTGVSASLPGHCALSASRRYLWTDAFAVCILLGLGEQELALSLIFQVHHSLGKHRIEDKRIGWLSGLNEKQGEAHPTIAGLRIGKRLPERAQNEPIDERLEWNRDGQYFHYLTKWMHALDQAARVTKQLQLNQWGRELAIAGQAFFTPHSALEKNSTRQLQMYWKMSVDLSYPLVFSQGQHDALDGYITYSQLHSTAVSLGDDQDTELSNQCAKLKALMNFAGWETVDPLGIGGLLIDAFRVYQLMAQDASADFKNIGWKLLDALLKAALYGLEVYVNQNEIRQPAGNRLAFRELGLCIGLQALELMVDAETTMPCLTHIPLLREKMEMIQVKFGPIRETIELFWQDKSLREGELWKEHQDINDVMLATCLAPSGFLILHNCEMNR